MDITRTHALPNSIPVGWNDLCRELELLAEKYGMETVANCHLVAIREASDKELVKVLKELLGRFQTIKRFLVSFGLVDTDYGVSYDIYLDLENDSELSEIQKATDEASYTHWPEYLQSTTVFRPYEDWDEETLKSRHTIVVIDRTTA